MRVAPFEAAHLEAAHLEPRAALFAEVFSGEPWFDCWIPATVEAEAETARGLARHAWRPMGQPYSPDPIASSLVVDEVLERLAGP